MYVWALCPVNYHIHFNLPIKMLGEPLQCRKYKERTQCIWYGKYVFTFFFIQLGRQTFVWLSWWLAITVAYRRLQHHKHCKRIADPILIPPRSSGHLTHHRNRTLLQSRFWAGYFLLCPTTVKFNLINFLSSVRVMFYKHAVSTKLNLWMKYILTLLTIFFTKVQFYSWLCLLTTHRVIVTHT